MKKCSKLLTALSLAAIFCGEIHAEGQWAVTAVPFKIKGEQAVNNVKLTWDILDGAQSYRILRNGEPVGETTSVVFDDYELPVGETFTYAVEACGNEGTLARSETGATTFVCTGECALYDNLNGKYLKKPIDNNPSGFKIGKKYYKYSMNSTTVDKVKSWKLTETVSKDGREDWSQPRVVAEYSGVNFEGNTFKYNPVTKKVVFISHYEDSDGYTAAKIFLAEITPGGGLKVGTSERPLGFESRDQSVFIDSDNTAYLLSATNNNNDINIYLLDKTWTHPIELCNTICKGAHRETPYIVKKDGAYYFFSSKASGWYPSQTMYCSATDLRGEWTPLRTLGSNSTFDAQFNRIQTWDNVAACWSYHWGAQRKYKTPAGNFPRVTILAFNGGTATMSYFRYVEFNDKYGVIPVQNGRILSLAKPVECPVKGSDGVGASCINDGAMCESHPYFKKSSSAEFGRPYMFTLDLQDDCQLSEINLATRLVNGSECAYKYTIEGSADNKNYELLHDGRMSWDVGFQILEVDNKKPYRYLRLRVYDVVAVKNGSSQLWADGVYELSAYGSPNKGGMTAQNN